MNPTRVARLQSVLMEEISHFVAREVKDPRIPQITVTGVLVTQDGSQARVAVTILGGVRSPEQIRECLIGLQSASGFMRRHLAKVLNIRHIPQLMFEQDKGLENAARVHELLVGLDRPLKKNED